MELPNEHGVSNGMFDQLPQSGTVSRENRKQTTFFVSLLVHAGVVVTLVTVPLLHSQTVPSVAYMIRDPGIVLQLPPPPRPAPSGGGRSQGKLPPVVRINPNQFVEPTQVPTTVSEHREVPIVDITALASAAMAIGSGLGSRPFGTGSGLDGVGIGPSVAAPAVAAPPPKPRAREPLRVSVGAQAANLIHRIEPMYPPLAVKAHVQGRVILQLRITEEGDVVDVKVLSGHVLLVDSAVEAVRQWRYRPTLLNGEPVSVIATVVVNFVLK